MNRIYKIKYWQLISFVLSISNLVAFNVAAQSKIINKYGLTVINNIKVLQNEITADPSKEMINLHNYIPGIFLDLKYATTDNFMHKKLYPAIHTTFLRKPAADALKKVAEDLKDQNLTLKIFDAFRPYSVTEKM